MFGFLMTLWFAHINSGSATCSSHEGQTALLKDSRRFQKVGELRRPSSAHFMDCDVGYEPVRPLKRCHLTELHETVWICSSLMNVSVIGQRAFVSSVLASGLHVSLRFLLFWLFCVVLWWICRPERCCGGNLWAKSLFSVFSCDALHPLNAALLKWRPSFVECP